MKRKDPGVDVFVDGISIALLVAALAFLALGLVGCGSPGIPLQDTDVDPALVEHVEAFLADCDDRGMGDLCRSEMRYLEYILVLPADHPQLRGYAGLCQYADPKTLEPGWVVVSEPLVEKWGWVLVYHELGHCVLGIRSHPEDIALLAPKLYKEDLNKVSREVLLDQLMSGAYRYGQRTESTPDSWIKTLASH